MTLESNNASGLVPSGVIQLFAGLTAPFGYLICDGSPISRVSYASLFNVIGTLYGAGDGTSTFNLPNLQGRVPVGQDSDQTEFSTLGKTGGEKTHTLSLEEIQHMHSWSTRGYSDYSNNDLPGLTGVNPVSSATASGHNNLQPYIAMNYIIKY
jgi:microcystin-dependent protein